MTRYPQGESRPVKPGGGAGGDDVIPSGGEAPVTTPAEAPGWFDQAREVARRGIRADKARVSPRFQELLSVIEARLFEKDFEVSDLDARFGLYTHGRRQFVAELGVGLRRYLVHWRMTAAAWLLTETELPIWKIGRFAGYGRASHFARAFRRWSDGPTPEEYRQLTEPKHSGRVSRLTTSPERWDAVLVGEVPWEEGDALATEIEEGGGVFWWRGQPRKGSEPRLTLYADRPDAKSFEVFYRALRRMPFRRQVQEIREVRFTSEAFFRLLGRKVIEESRQDRQQGIEVAKLALAWLDGAARSAEASRSSLQALAWAWLGNAHRLAEDFLAAERCFEMADRRLSKAANPEVEAELCSLKAALRFFQRQFKPALALLDRALILCRAFRLNELQVRGLLLRCEVIGASGDALAALSDHRAVISLLETMDAPELTLTAHQDLAVSLVRVERCREAMKPLAVAQRLCVEHGHPIQQHQLELVEGMVLRGLGEFEQAVEAFEKARAGMRALGLGGYVALVSLEFSLLRFHQGRYSEAATLASEALPLYGAQGIDREAQGALAILRESILADRLTEGILVQARDQLWRLNLDPRPPSRVG